MRPARRIVSQYWSIDEYLYSVVPPERVVAVSESAYLEGVSNAYPYVKRFHPTLATDPERVLRLDPDLVLVADSSRPDFCALVRDAHVPIYRVFTTFTTLQQIADTTRLTGYLTGEDARAAKATQAFWSAVNAAKAKRSPTAPHPRILGYGTQSTYGSETLFDDIVRTLGGINVAAAGGLKGYAAVNSEQIARWNPEWIVAGSPPGKGKEVKAQMLADPGIALTQAARNGHILIFDNRVFLPMSPFTALLVTAMSKALYG
jgi:iron complex transport system substrate-binding protein